MFTNKEGTFYYQIRNLIYEQFNIQLIFVTLFKYLVNLSDPVKLK